MAQICFFGQRNPINRRETDKYEASSIPRTQ